MMKCLTAVAAYRLANGGVTNLLLTGILSVCKQLKLLSLFPFSTKVTEFPALEVS